MVNPVPEAGIVRGRSTKAPRKPLNGKSCFKRVRAITVPITLFMRVVATARRIENLREKRASGEEMVSQNDRNPLLEANWNRDPKGRITKVTRKATAMAANRYLVRPSQTGLRSRVTGSVAVRAGSISIASPGELGPRSGC